ncbi:MAG: site-specific integrase [Erysipelotrichaceae bacterium]|nr:site-specific integrase [Erysipelotrichaceae bacterium]
MQQEESKFSIISKEWLMYKKLEVKRSSYVKYKKIIKCHLNDLYRERDIDDLDAGDYRDYFNKLKSDGELSNSMLNSIRIVLSGILEFGEDHYNLKHIDLSRIKLSRSKTIAIGLSDDEAKRLTDHCEKYVDVNTVPSYISLYSGMRLGEICGLRWEDVDFDNSIIHVRRTIERLEDEDNPDGKTSLMILDPKTESSKREVIIVGFLCDYLKDYKTLNNAQDSDYVISNNDKIPEPGTIERRHRKLCNSLDIDVVKFHALRHTFASACIAKEVDYKVLSEILGHSDVSITLNVYVHLTRSFKKEQIAKISKDKKK